MKNELLGKKRFIASLFVVVFLVGCAALKNDGSGGVRDVKKPRWVVKGSGAYVSKDGNVLQGIGMANEYKNRSLLQAYAENRAMDELRKVVQDYSDLLLKAFEASDEAKAISASLNMYRMNLAIKTVNNGTFEKAKVMEWWQHPETGEMYSLVRVGIQEFVELVEKSGRLNKEFKEYVQYNAGDIHKMLRER
jgi:hypothetical protein